MDTAPEFHAKAPEATVSEGPYVVARAGVESMTLRTKGVNSAKAPPHPIIVSLYNELLWYSYNIRSFLKGNM